MFFLHFSNNIEQTLARYKPYKKNSVIGTPDSIIACYFKAVISTKELHISADIYSAMSIYCEHRLTFNQLSKTLVTLKPGAESIAGHKMQHSPTYIQDLPIAISDVVDSSEQQIITDKLNHEKLNQIIGKEFLRQKITEEVNQSKQANKKFTILFLNFDRYWDSICRFNDSTEHKSSDEAVNIIARRLQQCTRDCDLICRCDNNEFIFLLPEICHNNEINTIVQMIYHHLREPLFIQNIKQPEVTSSIGISVYPDNGNNTKILLQNACLAMHQAKKDNGNTHYYYTGD